MKWMLCWIFMLIALISLGAENALAQKKLPAPSNDLASLYKAAIVIEAETGKVLFEDRSREKNFPASVVKMMVALLVLEQIEQGKHKMTDVITVSARASKIGGHQVFLKEGETFELQEMMKAVSLGSANDAATAVAEFIGGSLEGAVAMMNQRAAELGMKDTVFQNPHGLPPGKDQIDNITTAYDLALLGREVVKHEQYLRWSSTQIDHFRNGSMELVNTNRKLLQAFPGLDGLKTGYHDKAGFNVVATAKRNDLRLIAVVMGAEKAALRNQAAARLLTQGFNEYAFVKIATKGSKLGDPVQVNKGTEDTVSLLVAQDVEVLVRHDEKAKIQKRFDLPGSLDAPIKVGTPVGSVELILNDQVLAKVDLITEKDVEKLSWWKKIRAMLPFLKN